MTPSEEVVHALCQRSFLSLWSYSSPRRRDGRELCDVLVACDPDVIIFSVKEISLRGSGDQQIDWQRWQRKAIDESAQQLYGASRELRHLDRVIQNNGAPGLHLPPPDHRRTHLIAVALGSDRSVPIYSGDLGKGFVHVWEEGSLHLLLGELDTVADFVGYLAAGEQFHGRGGSAVISGGEENLLAYYLHAGWQFPADCDMVVVNDDFWTGFTAKPEFRARKEADEVSYLWDRLIELFCEEFHDSLQAGTDLSNEEQVVRTMARENRFSRCVLAATFHDWHQRRVHGARIAPAHSGIVYVFLAAPRDLPREDRRIELMGRCYVARDLNPSSSTVIGIGTEVYDSSGFSLDGVYLFKPEWTAEDRAHAEYAREQFGWFRTPQMSRIQADEFPGEQ
jgi:hypothetical protein